MIPIPPMIVREVLKSLREGYDAEQVRGGVEELCRKYPDDVPAIARLLRDVLDAMPDSAFPVESAPELVR